jgi:hypothetical protein
MVRSIVAGLIVLCAALAAVDACTATQGAELLSIEQAVQKDTSMVCAVAEPASGQNPYVVFVCTAAEIAEDAGLAVTQLRVRVAAEKAAAFALAHGARDGGADASG